MIAFFLHQIFDIIKQTNCTGKNKKVAKIIQCVSYNMVYFECFHKSSTNNYIEKYVLNQKVQFQQQNINENFSKKKRIIGKK